MREMDAGGPKNQIGRTGTPSQDPIVKTWTHDSFQGLGTDNEDEKERTIAKAALSIAELSTTAFILCGFTHHLTLIDSQLHYSMLTSRRWVKMRTQMVPGIPLAPYRYAPSML
jgi:hypothetical protein